MKKVLYAIFFLSVLIQSCKKDDNDVTTTQTKIGDASIYSGDIAIKWIDLFRYVAKREALNPPVASRYFAYAGVAMYESVVTGANNYNSLANQLNGSLSIPTFRYQNLDYEIACNEAMYVVAKNVLNRNISSTSNDTIEKLRLHILNQKRNNINEQLFNNSIEYGRAIGNTIVAWASGDNYSTIRTKTYTVPSRSENQMFWAPTDAVSLRPVEPFWGEMRPFTMAASTSCYVASQIPFSTTIGSDFYNQAMEVVTVKENLTIEQEHIAMWWADVPGQTPSPAGHWLNIASIIATQENLNLIQAAEMYALVGLAVGDAFISCWEAKYRVNLLRPKTYIRDYIAGQSNWEPKWATPPFPEYTSGHSVCSGASATVLKHLFGDITFVDNTNTFLGINERTYTTFNQAADEAAISRLYGGIHYREAIEFGIEQGNKVGNTIIDRVTTKN